MAAALAIVTEARPGDARTRLRRGEALYKLRRMRDSMAEVRTVLALTPAPDPLDLADAHFGAAMIEASEGDEARALEDLRLTLQLNPAHPRAEWIRSRLAAAAAAANGRGGR